MKPTSPETLENEINQNWARHFRCSVTTIQENGTTLLPEDKYLGDKVIALWYIGKHTFVQLDPSYISQLERVLEELPKDTSLTGDDLRQRWGVAAIKSYDSGLIYYQYPPELPNYMPVAPFVLRQLTLTDKEAMEDLNTANTSADVEEGFVEVTHEVAFGCFLNNQLVAAASGYYRTGFMDIGVLSHPGFRQRGLSKAVVGMLCEWSINHGVIAQYRCNVVNTSSRAVARALNFRLYFKSEGLWLN